MEVDCLTCQRSLLNCMKHSCPVSLNSDAYPAATHYLFLLITVVCGLIIYWFQGKLVGYTLQKNNWLKALRICWLLRGSASMYPGGEEQRDLSWLGYSGLFRWSVQDSREDVSWLFFRLQTIWRSEKKTISSELSSHGQRPSLWSFGRPEIESTIEVPSHLGTECEAKVKQAFRLTLVSHPTFKSLCTEVCSLMAIETPLPRDKLRQKVVSPERH